MKSTIDTNAAGFPIDDGDVENVVVMPIKNIRQFKRGGGRVNSMSY